LPQHKTDPAMQSVDAIHVNFSPHQLAFLNVCLAFLMFSVALDIKVSDFKQVFLNPKAVAIGLFSQWVVLPLLTISIIWLWPMPVSMALGMVLVAACPGGNVSNFAVYLSRGNSALSVTLTSISTLGAIIFTPLSFMLFAALVPQSEALRQSVYVEPVQMLDTIVVLIVLPLSLGMIVYERFPIFAEAIKRPAKMISMAIFLGFVVVAFYKNYENFTQYIGRVFFIVLIQNGLAIFLGYQLARLGKLPEADRRAVAIETGIQNSGLGLILIFNFFGGLGGMALVAAWWGIWHLVSGFSLAYWWGNRPADRSVA
jgi:BASS family bile acid:Na+ symporter